MRASTPQITAHCVLSEQNIEELPNLVELCKSMEIYSISTESIHNWTKYQQLSQKSVFMQDKEYVEQIFDEAKRKAKHYGIRLFTPPVNRIGESNLLNLRCSWPWTSCFITVDGYVTPCCVSASPNIVNFGNIFQHSFLKIWNGPKYQFFRNSFLSRDRPDICKNCYYLLSYGKRVKKSNT